MVTAYDVYATIIDIAAKGNPDVRVVIHIEKTMFEWLSHMFRFSALHHPIAV